MVVCMQPVEKGLLTTLSWKTARVPTTGRTPNARFYMAHTTLAFAYELLRKMCSVSPLGTKYYLS